jgi:hypothetical protein
VMFGPIETREKLLGETFLLRAHISGRRNSELLRVNPFCYIVNAGGGTRGDSEFRRPEMWAQDCGS